MIEVEPLSGGDDASVSHIRDLRQKVQALMQQVRDTLPDGPHCLLPDEHEWTVYELQPEKSNEYPGQLDMFGKCVNRVVSTCSYYFAHCLLPKPRDLLLLYSVVSPSTQERHIVPSKGPSVANEGRIGA